MAGEFKTNDDEFKHINMWVLLLTTVDHYEIGSVWPLFSSSRSPFTGSIMSVFDEYTLDDGQTDNWDDVCSLFTEITHPQCRRN